MPVSDDSPADDLTELESRSRLLDPDQEERRIAAARILEYIQAYLIGLPEAPAFFDRPDMGAGVKDYPISEVGAGLETALSVLADHVDSVGINTTSGRFLGYIPGGALFYAGLGDWLAATTNRYASVFFASPGAVRIENQLIRWMADLIGFPSSAEGYLASGGSMANLTAIVTAREARALRGEHMADAVVYATDHTHHCIDKALRIAGLGDVNVERIPVDGNHRMRVDVLQQAIKEDRAADKRPFMIIATAGSTNTGSVDPLDEIADVAEKEHIWYHIDAAYGGFFILCPEVRDRLTAMSRADSVVMDPHKTLFLPYGTGALLVRDGSLLKEAYAADADYLMNARGNHDESSPASLSPELTKHFRGLRLWLPLQVHGVAPFRAALSEKIQLARYFHERISRMDGFETGTEPDLSVVTYRYHPRRGDANEFNRKLTASLYKDGRIFISSSMIDGHLMLRMAAVCFRTHREDIDTALDILKETAHALDT